MQSCSVSADAVAVNCDACRAALHLADAVAVNCDDACRAALNWQMQWLLIVMTLAELLCIGRCSGGEL